MREKKNLRRVTLLVTAQTAYNPVSYTHRDVYKRQALEWATEREKGRAFLSACMGRPLLKIDIDEKETGRLVRCLLYTSRCV